MICYFGYLAKRNIYSANYKDMIKRTSGARSTYLDMDVREHREAPHPFWHTIQTTKVDDCQLTYLP